MDPSVLDLETKFVAEDDEGSFTGYASVFGNKDLGSDIVEKGAFDETIQKSKDSGKMPKLLWQHRHSDVIGLITDLSTDEKGLKLSGKLLLDLPLGKQTHILMKHKAVDSMSIGYKTKEYRLDRKAGTRILSKLDLWEVSVVTFPMNPGATMTGVKRLENIREVEAILRDAGVPRNFAELVALHGFNEAKARLEQRDVDQTELKELATLIQNLKETVNA